MFCNMCIWLSSGTETVSAAAAKWKRLNTGLVPKSSVSWSGTSVNALLRVVRPKTLSLTAPTVIRLSE